MRKASQILTLVLAALCVLLAATDQGMAAGGNSSQLSKPAGEATPPSGIRQECPPLTIFGQTPHDPADVWTAYNSDDGTGDNYIVYDNYDNADGTTGIRFWGLRVVNDGGWFDCQEDPMPFEIIFYTESGGQPGTAIATYNVTLTATGTGQLYSGFELFEWSTDLSPAPSLSGPGWVSVQGKGDPNCWFMWMSSDGLDNICWQWTGSILEQKLTDVSFCLYGEESEPCEWNPGNPYKMHYPQLPDTTGWDVQANLIYGVMLADDWRCTESGFVTDIHFWGSWMEGMELPIDLFVLDIYSDIPADQSPTGYSMPGVLLWETVVSQGQFEAIPLFSESWEGWFDPMQIYFNEIDHQQYFQYNVCIDSVYWFWQEENTVYWLGISAQVNMPNWGWKSSQSHWNDNAVWGFFGGGDWEELYDPLTFQPLDLAFVITNGDTGDCYVNIGEADGSGAIDIDDVVYLIQYIFAGGPAAVPYTTASGDPNCTCSVDIDDVVYLINYIFASGPPPCLCAEWVPTCGAIR